MAVQILMVPLYLQYLGTEKFGILAMILAANSYAAIGITWLSGGMARILAERAAVNDVKGFEEAYVFAKWLYVTYAVVIISILWLGAYILRISQLLEKEIIIAMILACFHLLLMYEYNADRAAFVARHWQAKSNVREIIGQIVFVVSVYFLLQGGYGLPSIMVSQILGALTVRILVWFFWLNDPWNLRWTFPTEHHTHLLSRVSGKMGRGYIVYGILLLTLQADALILGWLTDPSTVASYYLVWRIPEVMILLLWRIPGSYGPFLIAMDVKGEHQKLYQNYKKGLYIMVAMAGAGALLYGLAGRNIVNIWLGDKAPTGQLPYLFAAAAMFFRAVVRWPSGLAYSLLNTTPLNLIIAIELMVKIILMSLLIDEYGFSAPMLATALVHIFLVFYLYLILGERTVATKHKSTLGN
jgi:O-antigen/teichoic acid export membrane protein